MSARDEVENQEPTDDREPKGTPVSEDSLVLFGRVRENGDPEALNALLARYRPRLMRIVRIRLRAARERPLDASDIVQTTMIRAMHDLPKLELHEDAKLISWLSKVAERQILDQIRAQRALKRDVGREVELDALGGGAEDSSGNFELAAETTGVVEKLSQKEMKEIVDECLAKLPELHREVILLREFAGGSWRFVAQEMGRPSEDAARQAYNRARELLIQCVRRRLGDREIP